MITRRVVNPCLVLFVFFLLAVPPAASLAAAESCTTGKCHQALQNIAEKHAPVAEGDCLSCHLQQGAEHPTPGGKSFDLTAQGADLCYQCHDTLGRKRNVHDPVRTGDCLSCHQPHGAAKRFLLEVGQDQSPLCFGCHDEESFQSHYVHGPVAAGTCTLCHDPHQSDQKALQKAPGRSLCLNCHLDFAQKMAAAGTVHQPVKDDPCSSCHQPHSSPNQFLLNTGMPGLCEKCHQQMGKKLASAKTIHQPVKDEGRCGNCHSTHFSKDKGLLSADEKTVCLGCHKIEGLNGEKSKKKFLHGPVAEGECSSCHDPHGSDSSKLLTGPYPEDLYVPYQPGIYDFCLQCHDENMLRFEVTTRYTTFRNGNRNLHFVHVADKRKGRSCRICHDIHVSDGPRLISIEGRPFGNWKIPIGFNPTETGGSCAPGCHRPLRYDRETPESY